VLYKYRWQELAGLHAGNQRYRRTDPLFPLSHMPVVKDLVVNQSHLFD
jgi:succinate dehydrogenase/fumarate reductase-like Fe-S protein